MIIFYIEAATTNSNVSAWIQPGINLITFCTQGIVCVVGYQYFKNQLRHVKTAKGFLVENLKQFNYNISGAGYIIIISTLLHSLIMFGEVLYFRVSIV